MSEVKPKVGDRVRVVAEGILHHFAMQFPEAVAVDMDDTFRVIAPLRTVEILKPEPRPGEAWLVQYDELVPEVMLRLENAWRDSEDARYPVGVDYIHPIRRLIDPGEDS